MERMLYQQSRQGESWRWRIYNSNHFLIIGTLAHTMQSKCFCLLADKYPTLFRSITSRDPAMDLSASQQRILQQLKTRGPQTVKILAKQIDMTSMGVRQHLADLLTKDLITQDREDKQIRGRPVHLWKLTAAGHQQFPSKHETVALGLIKVIQESQGESALAELINACAHNVKTRYQQSMLQSPLDLKAQLKCLAELRSAEGYMAELRLLPDGNWLLIENHCPIYTAAKQCQTFCSSELVMFSELLEQFAAVERVDHLLTGARRCAYRVTQHK